MGIDFNDLGEAGIQALNEPQAPPNDWPDPEALIKSDDPLPYPLKALPGRIREAVQEVLDFTQTPPALPACSALAALSLAGQGLADVRRDEGLEGPVSLYFLVLADSGERKTSVDGHFMEGIREWEEAQKEKAAPLIKEYLADYAAWEAERSGLLAKIKNKPSQVLKDQLREHEQAKPEPPRYPRLTHENTTPESLAWDLSSKWPSGGIMSSEAGIVFGGHANGKDSIVRNLAQLNKLWDGGSLSVSRRTSESFDVRGARLTMGLATQPATILQFYETSRGLARGSGFSARFLLAWPESTQGFRPWKDAPPSWPHLNRFKNRLVELLDKTPHPTGGNCQAICRIFPDSSSFNFWS
jgi:putative DNA primase/helicase